ncbi:MAG TPA: type 1 glutamine amidotransferase, partial [Candidatus Kryptobacter bacterium]|nr:type 1 glutamine amidotransferase [Candidatus Kryptobacter bacterium]
EWARSKNVTLTSTKLFAKEKFPDPDEFDCLVVMGGPMGVHDEKEFPWMKEEKSFIENSIASQKRILGICLGAQLVADVLGSKVTRNAPKEIGWYPVATTPENSTLRSTGFLPDKFTAFHWHGDTFSLPPGAVRIAASERCENQGFVYGDRVIGLQFHLEVTGTSLAGLVESGRSELVADRFVQDERTILATREFIRPNNIRMARIMNNLKELS